MSAFSKHEQMAQDDIKQRRASEEKRKQEELERRKKEMEEDKPKIYEVTDEEEKKIVETPKPTPQPPKVNLSSILYNHQHQVEKSGEKDEEDDGKLTPNRGNGSQVIENVKASYLLDRQIFLDSNTFRS